MNKDELVTTWEEIRMDESQTIHTGKRWRVVMEGQFTEVQDFVSEIGLLLRSSLHSSEIKLSPDVDEENEESDIVRATLIIKEKNGDELAELKKLQTEKYKWITILEEGEELKDDNRDSLPLAWRRKSLCDNGYPTNVTQAFLTLNTKLWIATSFRSATWFAKTRESYLALASASSNFTDSNFETPSLPIVTP